LFMVSEAGLIFIVDLLGVLLLCWFFGRPSISKAPIRAPVEEIIITDTSTFLNNGN